MGQGIFFKKWNHRNGAFVTYVFELLPAASAAIRESKFMVPMESLKNSESLL